MILFTLLLNLSAFAETKGCRWATEGTNSNFEKVPVYNQRPRVVSEKYCGKFTPDKPKDKDKGPRPLCIGYSYCGNAKPAPKAILTGCQAIKNSDDDSWKCPSANKCMDDAAVAFGTLENPNKAKSADGTGDSGSSVTK
ncbi:MAG: hypothetical protein HC902_12875 [Calothrix sp. SM1_5_4]|nr:hypothetical protein [Calothrix sp. SM1_5_4]